jgi:hypothetical protein
MRELEGLAQERIFQHLQRGNNLGIKSKLTNPITQQPFEVLIATIKGDGVAERVRIEVPMEWDADLGD